MARKITILGHEIGYSPSNDRYIISHLCRHWTNKGFEVKIVRGINSRPDSDIILNHVDLTVTPDEYLKFMDQYSVKINFKVNNISKRLYSTNLLSKDDDYEGKVFLKTDANCGGKFDFLIGQAIQHGEPVFDENKQKQWESKYFMDSYNYRLFNSIKEIPDGAWENENLIIEKFVPEVVDDNTFQVRYWLFFGDREINIGVQSDKPVVKGPNITKRYIIEDIPDILREYRKRFGFDYGRFDYSILDDKVNLFDMNRTPTIGQNMMALFGDRFPSGLARGLLSIIR